MNQENLKRIDQRIIDIKELREQAYKKKAATEDLFNEQTQKILKIIDKEYKAECTSFENFKKKSNARVRDIYSRISLEEQLIKDCNQQVEAFDSEGNFVDARRWQGYAIAHQKRLELAHDELKRAYALIEAKTSRLAEAEEKALLKIQEAGISSEDRLLAQNAMEDANGYFESTNRLLEVANNIKNRITT